MGGDEDLPTRYRLVQLEKEKLKVQCKVDDFPQWGAPALDEPGYQGKEALQRGTPHSQRGSVFWALVERSPAHAAGCVGEDDDVGDDELVAGRPPLLLCHCESHMFDAVYRRPTGALVRGYTHHIGSVFTLPTHRGRGLARFFLTAIARRLAQRPDALGSVLYSDIGPTFYDALGWRLHPSTMAVLEVPTGAPASSLGEEDVRQITPLVLDAAFGALLAADNARVVAEIEAMDAQREVYAPLPTRDSIEWQFCLGVYYADVRGFADRPTACGAKIHDGAFVVWCHNIKESTLYIVHARFPDDDAPAVVQLLRAAVAEARRFQLKAVKIWDPAGAVLDPAVRAQVPLVTEDREDSLSSLMIFGHHRVGADADRLPLWLNNEKFAWV